MRPSAGDTRGRAARRWSARRCSGVVGRRQPVDSGTPPSTPPRRPQHDVDASTAPPPASAVLGATVAGVVATGLEVPWGLAFLPDGSALVSERDTDADHARDARRATCRRVGTVDGVDGDGEGGLLGHRAVAVVRDRPDRCSPTSPPAPENVIARMTYDGSAAVRPAGDLRRHPVRADPQRRPDRVRAGRLPLRRHRRGRPRRTPRRTRTTSAARSCGSRRTASPAPGNPFDGSPVWSLRAPQRAGPGVGRARAGCGPASSARTPGTS